MATTVKPQRRYLLDSMHEMHEMHEIMKIEPKKNRTGSPCGFRHYAQVIAAVRPDPVLPPQKAQLS